MSQGGIETANVFRATVGCCSDAGVKPVNEDAVGYRIPDDHLLNTKGIVVALADGVSTAEAGREAAELCIRSVLNDYYTTPETWSVKHAIQKILTPLNRQLYNLGHEIHNEARGYVTTLSVLVIKSHLGYLFHIGDSRIHRLAAEDGQLTQLTRDHTAGISTEQNYLIRAMGMDTSLNVDASVVTLKQGDIFLLTSDGVHDFLSIEALRGLIERHPEDYQRACRTIVAAARAAGSNDNLSCVLLRIDHLALENIEDLNERLTRLPFPPDLSPGLKIDGYEVLAEMYASERTQLYRVRDLDTGAELVMKTPSQNYCDSPAYIERFIMEEWIGLRVDHPNVVKVIAPKGERKFLYYLMELVPGLPLDQWLEQHQERRPRDLIALVEQIAAGLEALHEKETVHQDLKPGNIMVTPDMEVRIVDFGSVYVPGIHEIFTPMTREVALGTLDYADPAYRFRINTGIRGDIYSLGVIVYEMFTGFLPYGHRMEKCRSREDFLRMRYVPSYHHRDLIPFWFDRALEKAVSIEPEQRYETLQGFLRDLKQPNPEFLKEDPQRPVEKDMLLFWKMLSFVLFGLLIISLLVSASR
ncbi:MAG: serine/threonine protein kinase [Porticoccus sp.]|mgnify:CR=1 FL=1|uniref:bifunctional protein-serine/threonine kinase/phosphatase n=1 Tax=Porticoccus hydrocarbonoclasticus TaxID=1073414 RepID=UPI000C597C28|nr:bifunctional protein-serine/threonine kinase/phosphatase [Porticoccus hydrocarbonoclasticus]MBG58619.1 serine/threonine protein kinase [Porticoccus sp.]